MTEYNLTITSLGSSGDGVAQLEDERVHIPFALPGEAVRAQRNGKHWNLNGVSTPSKDRIQPVCAHFGLCGGCSLQHIKHSSYLDFKRSLIANALKSRGLDAAIVAPCRSESPGGRRRATFAVTRRGKTIVLGFHRRKSHEIVQVHECHVVDPAIADAMPKLRELADTFLPPKGQSSFLVTKVDNGLELFIAEAPKGFSDKDAMRTTATALELGFLRIAIKGHDALTREQPRISTGRANILPPSGGFLQATPGGEASLAELAIAHVGAAKQVADLFAGSGTFALRLAESRTVQAFESHGPAIEGLSAASRAAAGKINPIVTTARDLFRRPLLSSELNKFDAVVMDPPRAGAIAQATELAKSDVPRIAYVSCSPGTLARDLAVLTEGGYTVHRVTPVDQFVWSAHVEAVAELTRQ